MQWQRPQLDQRAGKLAVTRIICVAHAATSDAQSHPSKPGMMRRNGLTAKSVAASRNCPMGLRKDARMSCIWKRSRNAAATSDSSVSSKNSRA